MTESYVKLNAEKKYLYGVLQAAPRPESLKTPRKFVFLGVAYIYPSFWDSIVLYQTLLRRSLRRNFFDTGRFLKL